MTILFHQGNRLSKEVWVGWEWKPKLWSTSRHFFFIKKSIIDKILAVRLEALYWARDKVGCSFFLKNLGLAFGCFTLISIVYWWPTLVSVGGL